MRVQLALSVALILLIIGTASSATATETSSTTSSDLALTPITLSLISGDAEAAAGGPITGPGSASAAAASILEDPGAPPVPANARRVQPVAERVTVAKPKPKPKPRPKATHHARSAPVRTTGHVLRGAASWYCNSDRSRGPISACHYAYPDTGAFNAYAAAGPRLRAAMGSWRGRIVSVDGLRVKLVDWCQCYKGQSNEKLIDLYRDVYGVVGGSVTIRW